MAKIFKINKYTILLDDDGHLVDCSNKVLYATIKEQLRKSTWEGMYYQDELNRQYLWFYDDGDICVDVFDYDKLSDRERDFLLLCGVPLELDIMRDKLDEDLLNSLLKKYPGAYVPEYDEKSGLPILPKGEYEDWEY